MPVPGVTKVPGSGKTVEEKVAVCVIAPASGQTTGFGMAAITLLFDKVIEYLTGISKSLLAQFICKLKAGLSGCFQYSRQAGFVYHKRWVVYLPGPPELDGVYLSNIAQNRMASGNY